jgi:DNA processing protein
LALAPQLGPEILNLGDPKRALAATESIKALGYAPTQARAAALATGGWRALPWSCERYPASLRALADPPAMLWVRGAVEILEAPRVAIVGARQATGYGLKAAEQMARALAERGVAVVSGLARGVDAAAHRGALGVGGVRPGERSGGGTIAVLGHGPDFLYPASHRTLADAIADAGLLVSEFPPGLGPRKPFFPLRNRTISGLCAAVVVVEGRRRSGSLTTARHALDQGREVLAIPGPIDVATSEGPNLLLRDGAAVALDASDVLRAIGLAAAPSGAVVASDPLRGALSEGPATPDELVRRLGCDASEVARRVVELELEGLVEVGGDGRIYLRG